MNDNKEKIKNNHDLNQVDIEKNKKTLNKLKILFKVIGVLFAICWFGIFLLFFNYSSDKPIIYIYPKQTTELSVSLGKPENITCSYPKYDENGWQVVANPDGSLIDKNTGRSLYALYWEGKSKRIAKFEDGFVVKKEETITFLEEKLAILGLNEREAEEFIVYWLPRLQKNEYNLIRFESMDEINNNMPLEFSVKPDSVIRVMMDFKSLDRPIDIKEQILTTPERNGFVVVEWGGTEIKR